MGNIFPLSKLSDAVFACSNEPKNLRIFTYVQK